MGRSSTAVLSVEREAETPPPSEEAPRKTKAELKADKKNQLVPVLPSVNILSPWVFERMAISQLRQRFTLAGLVLILFVVAGWAVQGLRIDQAEKVLAVEQAETSRLTAETNELAPVQTFVATVGQHQLSVQNNMAAEIYFSRVVEELQNATPFAAHVESRVGRAGPERRLGRARERSGSGGDDPRRLPVPRPRPVQHQARDRVHHAGRVGRKSGGRR